MKVNFNSANDRFEFLDESISKPIITGAQAWVSYRREISGEIFRAMVDGTGCEIIHEEVEDQFGKCDSESIRCAPSSDGLNLTYRVKTYPNRQFSLVQVSLINKGELPIYLHECCLLDAAPQEGGRYHLPGAAEEYRFFKVGWHGWDYSGVRTFRDRNSGGVIDHLTRLSYTNPSTRRLSSPGEFSSEGWAILAGDKGCIVAGFVSMASQFGQVYACLRQDEVSLSVITQMDNVKLDPGEQRSSEWFFLQYVSLPNPEPQAEYVQAVAKVMKARVPVQPPPAMWTHWYQFFHDITEERFLLNLDVLADHGTEFPCQIVELDDGYQKAWGDWTSTNEKFPHGLGWLASEIRNKGFIPGLWLAPFAVQMKSEMALNHPDWLVKNNKGKPARAGFLYNMFIYALDLTHPEVLDHLRNLAHQLTNDWGYGMLKIDFLNAGAIPGRRFDPKLTRAEALRNGLEAIREGAGEETFLLGCGCPFGPAIGIVDAMRIGPDTAPSWTPYFHWMKWAGPLIKSNPSIPSLRNAIRNTLNLSCLHQKWWWNDPDCLLVREHGSQLSEAEVQSQVTLVGLCGGMVISSDDLQQVTEVRLEWMSKLVPNLGLRGLPLDVLEDGMPGVYRVKFERDSQSWQVVGVFNWKNEAADLCLNFSQLGYPPGTQLHLFDFWAEKYDSTDNSEIVFEKVPPHGCKLLRVCEAGEPLHVVGDTLHISMGAEIESLRIVNDAIEVNVRDIGRRVKGRVWVWNGNEVIEVKY